ncbi:MAG: cysteine synthase A [Rickettsiales bacterium]|jgi:cysteine synthase A|nr:cysteine synthase A [Rickettsiales bacterium]
MVVYKSIVELIGKTPMLELVNYTNKHKLDAKIIAKLEYFNAGGSIKDRIAKAMIEDGENRGLINKDTVIIEPTSGNTGIGLAMVAAVKGYRLIIVMPDNVSAERILLVKAYGAELILTDAKKGMKGCLEKVDELTRQYKNSFVPNQFTNEINPNIHKTTTASEIWEDMDGQIDVLVAGVGTGGTITGIGEFLRSKKKDIKIIAVEPFDSPVLAKGSSPSAHKIQGIGLSAGFIPPVLNTNIYDEIASVKHEDAFETSREVGRLEGLLVGMSGGAAIWTAKEEAKKNKNGNIVVIIPDNGERYLTTELYQH